LSHPTTFGYDTKGNLTTITNALSKVTTITVNPQGQPLTIKDPLNNITKLTYKLGDVISGQKSARFSAGAGDWFGEPEQIYGMCRGRFYLYC
jgi:uncharacterized protein RhaS with RHS repeats